MSARKSMIGRRSSLIESSTPTGLRMPGSPDLSGTPLRKQYSSTNRPSSIARSRQSLVGGSMLPPHFTSNESSSTPIRNNRSQSPSITPTSSMYKRSQLSSPTKMENVFPSLQEVRNRSNSSRASSFNSTTSVVSEGSSDFESDQGSSRGGFGPSSRRRKESISDFDRTLSSSSITHSSDNSSTDIANSTVVAQAVSQVQAKSQREIFELRKQISELTSRLDEKNQQIEDQTNVLKDLEATVLEFEVLSDKSKANDLPVNGENSSLIEQLKIQHQQEIKSLLEEREMKIATMKSEFDEKRSEFRSTIEALEIELQNSNADYIREIKSLQEKLYVAENVVSHVKELEEMVKTLEVDQNRSQNTEEEARSQLAKLAEAENKLLERDGQIKDMQAQLTQAKEKLAAMRRTSNNSQASYRNSIELNPEVHSILIETLKNDLELEKNLRKSAEDEIAKLEALLENKTFKETEMEREISMLQQRVEELESNSPVNEFIASGISSNPHSPEASISINQSLHHTPPKTRKSYSAPNPSTQTSIDNPSTPAINEFLLQNTPIRKNNETVNFTTSPSKSSSNSSPQRAMTSPNGKRISNASIGPPPLNGLPVYSSSEGYNTTTDSPIPTSNKAAVAAATPLAAKAFDLAAGRSNWCGLCEREGHDSLNCPYDLDEDDLDDDI